MDIFEVGRTVLIGTGGGLAVKGVDLLFRSRISKRRSELRLETQYLTEQTEWRKELRAEIDLLEGQVKGLKNDLDIWRDKYYSLQADYMDLKLKHAVLESRCLFMENEIAFLKRSRPILDAGPGTDN